MNEWMTLTWLRGSTLYLFFRSASCLLLARPLLTDNRRPSAIHWTLLLLYTFPRKCALFRPYWLQSCLHCILPSTPKLWIRTQVTDTTALCTALSSSTVITAHKCLVLHYTHCLHSETCHRQCAYDEDPNIRQCAYCVIFFRQCTYCPAHFDNMCIV